MTRYSPDLHHRRSLRLKGYDYTRAGAYFVTVCVQGREGLLGEVAGSEMRPSAAGAMVRRVWEELPSHYAGVVVDAFSAMPNHIHGIIMLTTDPVGAPPRGCPVSAHVQGPAQAQGPGQAQGPAPTERLSLADVVQRFKSYTTALYVRGVAQERWPPFPGRLWQRNYYEHIIRSDEELERIREYIRTNPERWALDRENPAAAQSSKEGAAWQS